MADRFWLSDAQRAVIEPLLQGSAASRVDDRRSCCPPWRPAAERCAPTAVCCSPSRSPAGRRSLRARQHRADRPQRYANNYKTYVARGGLVRPDHDMRGYIAGAIIRPTWPDSILLIGFR